MVEEQVYRCVEVRVQSDEQDDEKVPQHCGQVHAHKQGKEHALLLWPDGYPQEEEFRHATPSLLVPPPHVLLASAGNWAK